MTQAVEQRVRTALARAKKRLPRHVVALRHRLDTDSSGQDAVYVWIIIDDGAPEEVWAYEATSPLGDVVEQALSAAGVDLWPYVLFRAKSEQDEFDAERTSA
ncbi:MAG: hypothetical protein KF878_23050 [Planctomycetes bacterium]|nr:hypothetical protein [Planctomycetota bacterium]